MATSWAFSAARSVIFGGREQASGTGGRGAGEPGGGTEVTAVEASMGEEEGSLGGGGGREGRTGSVAIVLEREGWRCRWDERARSEIGDDRDERVRADRTAAWKW